MVFTDAYPASRVRGLDISTGQLLDIAVTEPGGVLHTKETAEIDGLRVVWTRVWDENFEDMDIYVTELVPEPGTALLLATGWVGLTQLLLRKRRCSRCD
jgi:hypothetical protein